MAKIGVTSVAFKDWHTQGRSDEEIERLAHAYRMAGASGDDSAPNVLELIERLRAPGGRLEGLRIVVRPDSEMPNDEACAFVDERVIEVRESVHEGARDGVPRHRMTLAHEVGHIALDHVGAPKSRVPGVGAREKFIPPAKSAERQATVFAAAFLMPRAQVRQCQSIEEVAHRLNVSRQAAIIRFDQVNVRDTDKKTPPAIQALIDKLKADARLREARPIPDSVLSAGQQTKLAWETAGEVPDHDPHEYRCIDIRWVIRWSRLNTDASGGWRIFKGRVVP
jgi:Zn-dependent peptidase ImmA (M78 family)